MATNKKKRFKRRPKLIQAQFKWYVLSLTLTGAALSVNEFFIGIVVSNVAGGNKPLTMKGHRAVNLFGLVPPPPMGRRPAQWHSGLGSQMGFLG